MTKENKKDNSFAVKFSGQEMLFEVGVFAEQASGSCLIQLGETTVLATAQIGQERAGVDFFPLTCEFEERFYAAGKILGSRFFRREGRPSIEATLSARMIDRTIRPLFPEGLTQEIQVIATCLSLDTQNDPDVLGILGASLALSISEIPWAGPIGAVRIGKIGDKLILNPSYEQREECQIDIVLSGHETDKGEVVVNMFDGKADEALEKDMEEIYQLAEPEIKKLIEAQKQIIEKQGKPKIPEPKKEIDKKLEQEVGRILSKKLEDALYSKNKIDYKINMAELEEEIKALAVDNFGEDKISQALSLLEKELDKVFKENVLQKDKRPDGRKLDEVRALKVQVAILPRTHGSGLFQRGQTAVLSILTLGGPGDQLMQEGMEISGKKRFMHHYNFPPYSVGEVKRLGSPGRREIGHGMLAERAISPILPSLDDFPYTIRAVSEVVSSNGSSSMASVSAACLALMDAGVPLKRPVAGIALGLVRDKKGAFKILTDIQGPEDHYGEMDFKVAGTEKGITAIQMDVKGEGINFDIFKVALAKAKQAREHILKEQGKVLAVPRKELSAYAPRIEIIQINPSKIGMVIGGGGKTINEIIEKCGVNIDIEDDGRVFVSSEKAEGMQKAVSWIESIVKDVEVGQIYQGKVVKLTDFGAFVEVLPGKDGLVHISQLAPFHVARVEDVVKEGEIIPVKVIGVDEMGKVSLSAKEAGFSPKRPPETSGGGPTGRGGFRSDFKKKDFLKKRPWRKRN